MEVIGVGSWVIVKEDGNYRLLNDKLALVAGPCSSKRDLLRVMHRMLDYLNGGKGGYV